MHWSRNLKTIDMGILQKARCKLGFHKPKQYHHTFKHKVRTTDKGRSKKRWHTWVREIVTVTYCEECGKKLSQKSKFKYR
jgi:hypothetical protein